MNLKLESGKKNFFGKFKSILFLKKVYELIEEILK